ARILIETNFTGEISGSLSGRDFVPREVSPPHVASFGPIQVTQGRPIAFTVKDLKPRHSYYLKFDKPYFDLVHSGFTTLNSETKTLLDNPIKMAVVAGNSYEIYEDKIPKINRHL